MMRRNGINIFLEDGPPCVLEMTLSTSKVTAGFLGGYIVTFKWYPLTDDLGI
jgi:hypothetical protein